MTPTDLEHARRLVTLRGWEWRDGMQSAESVTYYDTGGAYRGQAPDLSDDGTRGIVHGMLERRRGRPMALVPLCDGRYIAAELHPDTGALVTVAVGPSRIAALVAAWQVEIP